jgi:hypothetical protein
MKTKWFVTFSAIAAVMSVSSAMACYDLEDTCRAGVSSNQNFDCRTEIERRIESLDNQISERGGADEYQARAAMVLQRQYCYDLLKGQR